MKSQSIQLFEVDGGEPLRGCAVVKFVEWIVRTLHAAIEKVAGIGSAAVVGQFRAATVQRKIGGRGGSAALKQPRPSSCKAVEIKDIGLDAVWDAAHRVG